MRSFKGEIFLFITAFIWGTTFVAQSQAMDYIGPFTFNASRSFIGAIAVYIIINVSEYLNKEKQQDKKENNRLFIKGGVICGMILFTSAGFQQVGLQHTDVSKAGFITTLYIIFVPIIGIFLKKKAGSKVWISVIIAMIGMYLLSIKDGFTIEFGDACILMCAFVFSFQIIIVDRYSSITNAVKMSCVQLTVCGIASFIAAIIFENISISKIMEAIYPILYAGFISSGIAFTFQMIGQQYTKPAVSSLIMSLESVFAALGGWLLLNEKLSQKELIGCALVFLAVIIAKMPTTKTDKS